MVYAVSTHELTVRELSYNEYEAVITYDQWVCRADVNPASSVQFIEFDIYIESAPLGPVACVGPLPPEYVEVTAYIGVLSPGSYTVHWEQPGTFSLSADLVVHDVLEEPLAIPSSSLWALIALALGIITTTYTVLRS